VLGSAGRNVQMNVPGDGTQCADFDAGDSKLQGAFRAPGGPVEGRYVKSQLQGGVCLFRAADGPVQQNPVQQNLVQNDHPDNQQLTNTMGQLNVGPGNHRRRQAW